MRWVDRAFSGTVYFICLHGGFSSLLSGFGEARNNEKISCNIYDWRAWDIHIHGAQKASGYNLIAYGEGVLLLLFSCG